MGNTLSSRDFCQVFLDGTSYKPGDVVSGKIIFDIQSSSMRNVGNVFVNVCARCHVLTCRVQPLSRSRASSRKPPCSFKASRRDELACCINTGTRQRIRSWERTVGALLS
jgi:hypothetical protein